MNTPATLPLGFAISAEVAREKERVETALNAFVDEVKRALESISIVMVFMVR